VEHLSTSILEFRIFCPVKLFPYDWSFFPLYASVVFSVENTWSMEITFLFLKSLKSVVVWQNCLLLMSHLPHYPWTFTALTTSFWCDSLL
jgi:hypothetical protein